MFFFGLGINQDVIEEYNHELVQVVMEDVVSHRHKGSRGVGKAKWHNKVFKVAISCTEGGLVDVTLGNANLVVAGTEVNLGEVFGAM